jgi:hypothetical protein
LARAGKFAKVNGLEVAWSVISRKVGKRSQLSCFKNWQKMTGLLSPSNGGRKQQYKEDGTEKTPPPGHNTTKEDTKMDTHKQVDMHTAPTAGAAAAMAVGPGNCMGLWRKQISM